MNKVEGTTWGLPQSASYDSRTGLKGYVPPFVFGVHPKKWRVREGKLEPIFTRIALEPGVNGYNPKVRNIDEFFGSFKSKGWTIIDPAEGYVRQVVARDGAPAHIAFFEDAYPGEEDTVLDIEARDAWIEELIERGIISYPHVIHLTAMRRKIMHTHNRLARKGQTASLPRLESQIATLDAYINGDLPAKAKPSRRVKKSDSED